MTVWWSQAPQAAVFDLDWPQTSRMTKVNLIKPQIVYFEYYMWNITNPDEFEAGEKPNYVQKGPYTYVETYNKIDVVQEYGDFDNSSWIGYTYVACYYAFYNPQSKRFF